MEWINELRNILKNLKNSSKYRGTFFVRQLEVLEQSPCAANCFFVFFVLVSLYFRLYSIVLCLFAFRIVTKAPRLWRQRESILSAFLNVNVPRGMVPAWRKVWGTLLIMWGNERARM